MFSDKTKSYFLATSKKAFLKNFNKKEFVQQFNFGEVLFVLDEFNNLYALENKCPHQGLKMQGCKINKGKVICPWHQYKFDLKNGRGHGLYLPTFELEENSKGFFLKRTYFSWFGE
jgi:nitrite reductase/ring-hydroxylating ferredoxin subunit